MKRKVCAVVTARPSYSRIKTALRAIQAHPDLQLQLVVAASALLPRYGTAINVMERDGFTVDARVFMVLEGESPTAMAKTTGLGVLELSAVFDNLRPDVVLTVADRYETLATAVAAAYMNIPLLHVQGGEVTGSIDEKVRHSVTKLADLHFVATQAAARRVIAMGEDTAKVFVTGCPSIDLAAEVLARPELDFDPIERYGGVGAPLDLKDGYVVVLQHPVTTEFTVARQQILESLQAVRSLGVPALWFWPNVDAGSDGTSEGIRAFREAFRPTNMHFFKNMAPEDFLRILINCRCIIGNSSAAIRECSYLGVRAVNIGTRQQGRERAGNVVDVDYDREQIEASARSVLACDKASRDHMYGDGRAGQRIADLLATQPLGIEKRLTY